MRAITVTHIGYISSTWKEIEDCFYQNRSSLSAYRYHRIKNCKSGCDLTRVKDIITKINHDYLATVTFLEEILSYYLYHKWMCQCKTNKE